MLDVAGYTKLSSSTGTNGVALPGSGATITLWSSVTNNGAIGRGLRWKRIVVNIFTSHASATNGLLFQYSSDGGTTWRDIGSFTIAASTVTQNFIGTASSEIRVKYTNSASSITTWDFEVLGDPLDRTAP